MSIEFHPEAERELTAAFEYYETQGSGTAERFVVEVDRALDLLLAHPQVGVSVNANLRKFVLRRFPFALDYSRPPDELRVEVVAHQHRRPDYWKSRKF